MRFLIGAAALLAYAAGGPAQEAAKPELEWLLIYYMSYDNNLEACGPVILDGLQEGAKEGPLAVTVLADFRDRDGLRRIVLSPEGRQERKLDTDNSASESVLEEYVAWAAKSYPAKRYAVVFLDHGGELDEMSLDEQPGEGVSKKWLSARKVGPLLRKFREDVGGKVELVFLQQCGRGSIDNLYNFRGAGAAVMASQTSVGAPNTYYAPTLKWLAKHPAVGGIDLARRIMKDDEHYTNYVCVRDEALGELAKRIDPVVDALLPKEGGELVAPKGQRACFGGRGRGTESNYDLLSWLDAAFDANERPKEEFSKFNTWVREKLVAHHQFREGAERGRAWCGVSVFVPKTGVLRERYKDYPLYQDSRLDDLWKAMYGEK